MQASGLQLFKKETLAQVFSCELCGIFKNIYFYATTLVAAPVWSYLISSWDMKICARDGNLVFTISKLSALVFWPVVLTRKYNSLVTSWRLNFLIKNNLFLKQALIQLSAFTHNLLKPLWNFSDIYHLFYPPRC